MWTNPNPSEIFDGQVVAFNSSDYDYVVMVCAETKDAPSITYTSGHAEAEQRTTCIVFSWTADKPQRINRHITVSSDKSTATITRCAVVESGQSSSATDNTKMIPLKIIGYCYQ